jgi:hypothetical protein
MTISENNSNTIHMDNLKKVTRRGLFYNSSPGVCSIWESGRMCYEALKTCNDFEIDYTDTDKYLKPGYDFYVINWHDVVCNWISDEDLENCKVPKFAIVTEVCYEPGRSIISRSKPGFTYYIVLDPTISDEGNIISFTRPIKDTTRIPIRETCKEEMECPIIGMFGFATYGKEWHKVVEAVQNEYDHAIIRINIPEATFLPNNSERFDVIYNECNAVLKKDGIRLYISHVLLSPDELITWCAYNTLNVFFYNRTFVYNVKEGLCATVDQAVASRRPLLVSEDPTFRHVHAYLKPYPETSLREAILGDNQKVVCQIARDWHPSNFADKFKTLLKRVKIQKIL